MTALFDFLSLSRPEVVNHACSFKTIEVSLHHAHALEGDFDMQMAWTAVCGMTRFLIVGGSEVISSD